MAADYAQQAAGIYDPQLAAEKGTETAAYNANKASFQGETDTANQAYTDALKSAGQARDTSSAAMDHVALTHGLFSSGLASNQQRLVYQTYQDNAQHIAETRANKLADIARRSTAEDQSYQAKLAGLESKYQGEKANYVATHQNEDAKIAEQERQAAIRQAASDARYAARQASKGPTAAQQKQSAYANLSDDVAGLLQGYGQMGAGERPKGYTEAVISKLQNMYAPYGISAKDIASYVYNYRKTTYGN